jgi:hypothetical protein
MKRPGASEVGTLARTICTASPSPSPWRTTGSPQQQKRQLEEHISKIEKSQGRLRENIRALEKVLQRHLKDWNTVLAKTQDAIEAITKALIKLEEERRCPSLVAAPGPDVRWRRCECVYVCSLHACMHV